jgi:hypothetical protein
MVNTGPRRSKPKGPWSKFPHGHGPEHQHGLDFYKPPAAFLGMKPCPSGLVATAKRILPPYRPDVIAGCTDMLIRYLCETGRAPAATSEADHVTHFDRHSFYPQEHSRARDHRGDETDR